MPVSGTVSITGGSATISLHEHGHGFGIFSSYSAFASETFSLTPSGAAGHGTFGVSLDTDFGDVVFSGTDTISAANGVGHVVGSETLSFVFGRDTLTSVGGEFSLVGSYSPSLIPTATNYLEHVASTTPTFKLPDSVAAGIASQIGTFVANNVTVTGGGTTSIPLGESNSLITYLGLPKA